MSNVPPEPSRSRSLILVQAVRRAVSWKAAGLWIGVLLVGLAAQWWTAANAAKPRVVEVSREAFDGWVGSVPDTILTYWPGLRLTSYDFFGVFPVTPLSITGAIVAIAPARASAPAPWMWTCKWRTRTLGTPAPA